MFLGVDRDDLVTRLLGYANHLVHTHTWRGMPGAEPPNGSAEDLVQTAFQKYASGARRCPPNLDPYTFFVGIIRSEFSHLLAKRENRFAHLAIVNDASSHPGTVPAEVIEEQLVDVGEPESAAAKWLPALRDRYGESSLPVRYVELIADGTVATAATYADVLGVNTVDIFNLNRLLRRFASRFRSKEHRRKS